MAEAAGEPQEGAAFAHECDNYATPSENAALARAGELLRIRFIP